MPDTNVFISFLLNATSSAPPSMAIRAGLAGSYTLLVSDTVLLEVRRNCMEKPDLASRLSAADIDELAALLTAVAIPVESVAEPIVAISRDPKDDSLLVEAALAGADVLVTGDNDLLDLEEFEGVRIVNPATFARILDEG